MKHHYVPRFYLKQWIAENGELCCYERKPSGSVKEDRVSPKGTSFAPDLYAAPSGYWQEYDPDIIEKDFFAKEIDDKAAPVLRKLVSLDPALAADQKDTFAQFLAALGPRHPDRIRARDADAPRVVSEVRAEWLARYENDPEGRRRFERILAEMDVEQMAKTSHRTLMVQQVRDPRRIAYVAGRAWKILTMKPEFPLITTDRPLLAPFATEPHELADFMTFPLCPTKLLVMYPPEHEGDPTFEGTLGMISLMHDVLLVDRGSPRFVYANRTVDDDSPLGVRLQTAIDACLSPDSGG